MKTKPFLTTSLLLVTIVAFVYFAQPIYAKANSSDMEYITTTMSSNEVAQLFSGVETFIPAAIIIIGFIVMMYCTLRNIDIPINFSGQQSFIDKCQSLGQFMIDHISDDVKDFFYSVYTYCQDNNITSVTGMAAFVMKHAATFFTAIAKWVGGSVINNPSDNAVELSQQFSGNTLSLLTPKYDFFSNLVSVFPYSFSIYNTIGYVYATTWDAYYTFYTNFDLDYYYSDVNCVVIYNSSSRLMVEFYHYDGVNLLKRNVLCQVSTFRFANTSNQNPNVAPNRQTYVAGSFTDTSFNFDINYNTINAFVLENIISFVQSFGIPFYFSSVPLTNTLSPSNVSLLKDVLNPASDQFYSPTADQVDIDIVGTYADIAAAAAAAAASGAVVTALDKIQAYVGNIGLTLESAIPQDVVVDNAGNYHFPNLDGIWKYPRYFFDMLKGWGSFVGGCLNAVTVGEGGLSWIFYGGFIILICGGVVGKIILG